VKKHLMSTWTLRLAALTIALAVVPGLVVPAGAKDKTMSKKEVRTLIENAKTPADHERIAQYFDAEAARYEAESKKHEEEATYYASHVQPSIGKNQGFYSREMQDHCPKMAAKLKEAAQEARMVAAGHRALANETK